MRRSWGVFQRRMQGLELMDAPLNFHHLRYFWLVAREGSVTRGREAARDAAHRERADPPARRDPREDLFRRDGRRSR